MLVVPKKGARIVVAMSGGVDSSVAAALLKSLGYEVIGISLQLHNHAENVENKFGTCCSLSDISDARRVAEKLEIPFYVKNMETEFREHVIDDFVDEYLRGRTPNPCVRCNEKVKFSRLLDWALDLGAEYLATGHYANMGFDAKLNQFHLLKGRDAEKDQSYFLFPLKQDELRYCMFPVGNMSKLEVRKKAQEFGLLVSNKPDSQEICFVQGKSYREFIEERVKTENSGNIVDSNGKVLGRHGGIHHFTLGQRKGLGIPTHLPYFVLELRPEANEVVVGPEELLFQNRAVVQDVNWINPMNDGKFEAKVRYRCRPTPVNVEPLSGSSVSVSFESPQRAITPGQAMVFYDGDRVVGGGWIESVTA